MINKKDYEKRLNSYFSHVSGDGQTIKNLLDVFYDMLGEIESIKDKYEAQLSDLECNYRNKLKEYEKTIEERVNNRLKLKQGDIKTAVYRALKKYIDVEFKEIDNAESI